MFRQSDLLRKCGSRLSLVKLLLFRNVLPAFLLVTLCPIAAPAQGPEDDEVLSVTTDLLLFPARIRDKKGGDAPVLTEKDLALRDKDNITSGIYFSPGVDRVAMVFALDQSGSLREIIARQSDAALGLYGRFSDRSSIAVLQFAATPFIAAPFERKVCRRRFGAAPSLWPRAGWMLPQTRAGRRRKVVAHFRTRNR